jgi:hypothetical protein
LHLIWALRIWWPLRDERALARAVVGATGIDRMPGQGMTFGVAAVLGLGIVWTMALAGWIALPLPGWFLRLGGFSMAAILLVRGIVAYTYIMRNLTPEEPFATLNQRYYSPLIIALGLGALLLTLA